jgi:hypothetical protein
MPAPVMPGATGDFAPGKSSVVSGPYVATYNGMEIGQITPDGYELSWQNQGFEIRSDMFGEGTKLDEIYQGTSARITFTIQHWNAQAIEAMIWWMGNLTDHENFQFGHIKTVGASQWDQAKVLVLESCFSSELEFPLGDSTVLGDNVPNNKIDPLDITFPKTLLANGEAVRFLMSSRPRFIPITLDIYPVAPLVNNDYYDVARPSACSSLVYWEATRNPKQPTPTILFGA